MDQMGSGVQGHQKGYLCRELALLILVFCSFEGVGMDQMGSGVQGHQKDAPKMDTRYGGIYHFIVCLFASAYLFTH